MLRRSTAWVLMIFVLLVLGSLFLLPLVQVVGGGLFNRSNGSFTLAYVAEVFRNPIYREGLLNSVGIALATTTVVSLIAVPLAWLSNRYDFAGKSLVTALLLVPMILPPFVGAIGLQRILGQYGAFNALFHLHYDWLGQARVGGVILLEALGLYPIMYLNVAAALANVDPALDEAAQNLGCTGFAKFRKITLPLIMPGLFAGGTIVFIWSFTELGTPLILNYRRCLAVQVWDELLNLGDSPLPYALVIVMLVASAALYMVSKIAFGRKSYAMQSKAMTASGAQKLGIGSSFLIAIPFLLVVAIALMPHIGVVLNSVAVPGSWYRNVFPSQMTTEHFKAALGHEMTVSSIYNSLLYSSLAIVANVVLGLMIAFVVVRSTIPGRGMLDSLSMLPLAVPGLVMAFGYLSISFWLSNQAWVKHSDFWSKWLNVRENPLIFLVIAYAIRRLPYVVRSAVAGLQQTSVTFEEAAANLGASWRMRLAKVTLPLITANLLAGALLAFAFSMLEVSDSLVLAQRQQSFPITKAIFELFQIIGTGKYLASALGVWAMAFLAVTIIGCSLILGKRLGALFRV